MTVERNTSGSHSPKLNRIEAGQSQPKNQSPVAGPICSHRACLASPANFIYGRVLAKVLSHVTIMPVLLRPVNNFMGQVIGNASEGKYNTVNNSSSGEVTFQKCLISGITLFSSKNSNKSQTFATGAYQRPHEARPRRVVWLWEPEYHRASGPAAASSTV